MAGLPQNQVPRTDLPGLEYISLAANAFASPQRRFAQALSSPEQTLPPAGTTAFDSSIQLVSRDWVADAGLYIHDVYAIFAPFSATDLGQFTIGGVRLFLSGAPAVGIYDIGFPALTTLTPQNAVVAIRDQFKMVTQRDITDMGDAPTGNLFLTSELQIKNDDPTVAHNFITRTVIIASLVRGLYR